MNLKYGLLPLAAMASAALPEVKFVRLAEPQQVDNDFLSTALVDERNGRWIVTCPRTKQAGIQLETQAAVMTVLCEYSSQLPFKIVRPAGFARFHKTARALVYPALPGKPIHSSDLVYPSEFTSNFGAALGHLHSLPEEVAAKANLPSYSRTEIRNRWLMKLSRVNQQTDIPPALRQRWESALGDNDLWQFSPKFVHGALNFDYVFKDTQKITGLANLGLAHFGDPALDLAWVNANASKNFMEQFLESYQRAGGESSSNLQQRIEITGELVLLDWFLYGVSEKNQAIIQDAELLITQLYESLLLDGKIQLPDSVISISQDSSPTEPVKESSDASEESGTSKAEVSATAGFPSEIPKTDTSSPLEPTPAEAVDNIAEAVDNIDSGSSKSDRHFEAKIQDHLKTSPIEKTQMEAEANRSYWD